MSYWARARSQLRRTCADELAGDDVGARALAARLLVEQDCAADKHSSETDEETGNEVCRFCGTVTDDYSDVVAGIVAISDPVSDSPSEEGRRP